MRASFFITFCFLVSGLLLTGCDPEIEDFTSDPISDYLPLQPGKYITYRLDSTVYTAFGRVEEVHSYQEKNVVDVLITDNLGRPSYRINRFLRDTAGLQPWRASDVYYITPLEKSAEYIESNLRTIRLAIPIGKGFTWRGNNYLPLNPYGKDYSFTSSTNTELNEWEFRYDGTGETAVINGITIPDVITIHHIDEEYVVEVSKMQGKTYSEDRYAKRIGLVYQQRIMWEQQPNTGGSSPYKIGFGVKRSLLDHN